MSTDFRISKRRAPIEEEELLHTVAYLQHYYLDRLATLLFGAPAPRTVRLLRGDIAQSRCAAIAVSANPLLEGVARSTHWRFAGRSNADGAVRAAGGASLAAAISQMRESEAVLEPGMAAVSRAGRSLGARWVVHAVAPDAMSRSRGLLAGPC